MESERLRITAYADLTSKSKSKILNSSYYSEVTVGTESDYNDTIKQKECIINIYKDDDVLPRCTVKVVRMTKENTGNTGVPQGTIIPWYGNLNNIPDGFALCNGQNGTPDLRDKFLVGAGSGYNLGNTGGTNTVTLTVAQMPSHNHNIYSQDYSANFVTPNAVGSAYTRVAGGWAYNAIQYTGGNQPHENRPPYFAVYYLMKL